MDVFVEEEKEDVCNAEKGVREEGGGVEGRRKEGGGGGRQWGEESSPVCRMRRLFGVIWLLGGWLVGWLAGSLRHS